MSTDHLDFPNMRSDCDPDTENTRMIQDPPGPIPSPDAQLWRFMDLPKLVSILDRNALFFTRVPSLNDPFEGTWSNATLQLLEGTTLRRIVEDDGYITLYGNTTEYGLILIRPHSSITDIAERQLFERIIAQGPSPEVRYSSYRGYENSRVVHHVPTGINFMIMEDDDTAENKVGVIGYKLGDRDVTIRGSLEMVRVCRRLLPYFMVNCWHESEYDSEAMWRTYAGGEYGVAIRTNVESLTDSLVKRRPNATIGRVVYIPYDQQIISLGLGAPLWFKRRNFDSEREVRVVLTDLLEHQTEAAEPNQEREVLFMEPADEGRFYGVDPTELIREIVISPYAQPWLLELTRSVMRRYGLDVPVVQSSLNEKPSS